MLLALAHSPGSAWKEISARLIRPREHRCDDFSAVVRLIKLCTRSRFCVYTHEPCRVCRTSSPGALSRPANFARPAGSALRGGSSAAPPPGTAR
ncbi:hypothetical protein HPB50_020155 [Hyalomma asiaticum]|uniref:Uncharacterized protein n=1 Tax=Hyalomma asiaticum TaxID=266040 RepID=A0ACB7TKI8_HYAAI|nr:hypothetical protein HPB50_020155 [Hyalomma asiaticum]